MVTIKVIRPGISLCFLIAFSLAGCASKPPTIGEKMRDQGNELAAVGEQWLDAERLIEAGEEDIETGEEMIDDGEDLIDDGKGKIKRGKKMMDEAEAIYRQRGIEPPAAS